MQIMENIHIRARKKKARKHTAITGKSAECLKGATVKKEAKKKLK